ncbi:MAG: hypothetical protein C5B51_25030 [Terriglobia bacterium]|nr:MAG: hypothetical protein C5B51_25030 [Terriglobia bacterium]
MRENAGTVPGATTVTPGGVPSENLQTDTVTIPVRLCNLPPFHSIANQVLSLSSDPDIDLKRLAKVMEADPAFAAEVLFLANSSLFGFTSQMHVLRHAVAILGLERIKALAVTVAMRTFMSSGGPVLRACWRHSAACAIIAEEIAGAFGFEGERAYTVSLMHDIGRLGLLKSYPSEMGPILQCEFQDTDEVLRAERVAVDVDHATAGAWLVTTWAFPRDFVEVCTRHHEPFCLSDSPLLMTVKVACRMADALGFAAVRYATPPSYHTLVRSVHPNLQRNLPDEENLKKKLETRVAALER